MRSLEDMRLPPIVPTNIYPIVDLTKSAPVHPTKKAKTRRLKDIKRIVWHTTDCNWSIEKLITYDLGPNHIDKTGCPTCTYNEVVMPDGSLVMIVPWDIVTWHVGYWNPGSLAIALMYEVKNDTVGPSPAQYKTICDRTALMLRQLELPIDSVVGHRELKDTGWLPGAKGSRILRKTCPGLALDMDKARWDIRKA